MGLPEVNLDEFVHRPAHNVVGVLATGTDLPGLVEDLTTAGINPADIRVLCGEKGAEILDERGEHHGLKAHLVRGFQRLGYDQTTLAIFDEALRDGGLLLHVPASQHNARAVAAMMWRHGARSIGYFGAGTFEEFSFEPKAP